jgi:hypothetical protein
MAQPRVERGPPAHQVHSWTTQVERMYIVHHWVLHCIITQINVVSISQKEQEKNLNQQPRIERGPPTHQILLD